jgi:alkylhydroperoxidase family enzyme
VARIAYKPLDNAGPEEMVAPIRARRGAKRLNRDRAMLHCPSFAAGWSSMIGGLRKDSILSGKTCELAICVVSALNHADLELNHHVPTFLKAGGTEAQVDALADRPAYATLFAGEDLAVAQLAHEMTRDVRVSDATFALLKAAFKSDGEQTELVPVDLGLQHGYAVPSRLGDRSRLSPPGAGNPLLSKHRLERIELCLTPEAHCDVRCGRLG